MVRKTQQVEVRMIAEYLQQQYPKDRTMTDVPLGKISETMTYNLGYQKAMGVSRPYRPKVDALVVMPRHLILIEAKVWNVVNGLAKLPIYKSLIPFTPELQEFKDYPVVMELVVGWTNDNLDIMARNQDVKIRVFCPDWLQQVVERMHNYWTADYRRRRADILSTRETLGLE